jgi:hypothetical protein
MRSLEKPEAPPRRRWQHCSSSQGPVTLSRAFMLSHRQPFLTLSELRYCLGECRKLPTTGTSRLCPKLAGQAVYASLATSKRLEAKMLNATVPKTSGFDGPQQVRGSDLFVWARATRARQVFGRPGYTSLLLSKRVVEKISTWGLIF